MNELKSCPCCGGRAAVVWRSTVGRYSGASMRAFGKAIECINCGVTTKSYLDEVQAIEAWNKRVDEEL